MSDDSGTITILLHEVKAGTPGAADRLMAMVYEQLKHLARNRATSGGTMDPTTLAHEAYLRLFGKGEQSWENRHHFFWAAARAMRDILVERSRQELAAKRGGGKRIISLDADIPDVSDPADMLAINDALKLFEVMHPLAARLVMLRFFAGLTREEVAEVSGLSEAAVWREWVFAKAWLLVEIEGSKRDVE